MHIIWGPQFEVHVKILDDQHKETIRFFNVLDDYATGGGTREEIQTVIASALNHLDFHIATEEHYFDQWGYEHAAEHKEAHRVFMRQVRQVAELYRDQPEKIVANFMPVFRLWLEDHTAIYDKKYEGFFHAHGMNGVSTLA